MIRIPVVVLLYCFAVLPLHSQDEDALSKKVDELWAAQNFPEAAEANRKLIELRKPNGTTFAGGTKLSFTLYRQAWLHFLMDDFAAAEAVLLERVEMNKRIKPDPRLGQATADIQGIINDWTRNALRMLMNFYFAAGNQKGATQAFLEAQKLEPRWKVSDRANPAAAYNILTISTTTNMAGHFYRRSGDYIKASEAHADRLKELDTAWAKLNKLFGSMEQMKVLINNLRTNYLKAKMDCLIELAEISALQNRAKPAIAFCNKAREAAASSISHQLTVLKAMKLPQTSIDLMMSALVVEANAILYDRSAKILKAAGDLKGALALLEEGKKKRKDSFRQHRRMMVDLNMVRPEESMKLMGDLQVAAGKAETAVASYEEALKLLGEYQYPAGHPARLEILESLALLRFKSGDAAGAKKIATEVALARLRNLESVLAFASESQRLAFRSSVDPWSLFASLRMPNELFEIVVRTKGAVLDSLLEDRELVEKAKDPAKRKLYDQLREARRQMMAAVLAKRDTKALESQIAGLEKQLATGKRRGLRVTPKQVAAALPKGSVLVEYIRYKEFRSPGIGVDTYGAIVVKPGAAPVFVPLVTAGPIDRGIGFYANGVRAGKVEEKKFAQLLQYLWKTLFKPLEGHIPQNSVVFLAPDSQLNFVSFAGLLDANGKFLAEKYRISYVTAGRDLVRGVKPSTTKGMIVFANPNFQLGIHGKSPTSSKADPGRNATFAMRGTLGNIRLAPLQGTKIEAQILEKIIGEKWNWDLTQHLEKEALESHAYKMKSPRILHMATHGFLLPSTGTLDPLLRARRYWEDASSSAPKTQTYPTPAGTAPAASATGARAGGGQTAGNPFEDVALDNPMHRSGLALTGAEATLKFWGKGLVPNTAADGILNAEEMGLLDLSNTDLVVLSACETGLGEGRTGEGVLGMRRGLMKAGAKNTLLTLWPVADRETVLYMMDFYNVFDQGKQDPATVAHAVQLKYLKQFRKEKGVHAAVKLAAPFVLSQQR